MNKKTIRDLRDEEVRGKRALVRVDFNVPLDDAGSITDDTRIRAAVPTIRELADRGARVVLCSHLGRPKGKADPKYSLEPVVKSLGELLGKRVRWIGGTDLAAAAEQTRQLKDGEVALVENTRFYAGEEKNDEGLARQLAALGDFYVNDAFGSAHRAHSSTEGVARFLRPAVAGLLMEKELDYLGSALEKPKRPFVAVLGGAKISGKIDVIQQLLPKVDRMIIGGAMANTFFKAMGVETGKSLVEPDRVDMAGELLRSAGQKLLLPVDARVAASLDGAGQVRTVSRDAIPADQAMFDIGPDSADLFIAAIHDARTVVWNGPMGVFETPPFDQGTLAVARALAEVTRVHGATTIVGGGDSAAAIAQAGLEGAVSHVSTGGGASLEFLEGKTLPGVEALDERGAA
ncbi:MAG: phosphoglycerate kinase [Gemmatimonadaceae bacterium]